MRAFTWLEPGTTTDAVALLREHAPGARLIAGGQSLLLAMKDRTAGPTHLVSLAGVEGLAGVRTADDGSLVVGAATTYTALTRLDATALGGWHGVLGAVAGDLADRPVRNRGTVGGSLCTGDPRYDVPVLAAGVDATLRITGAGGDREVPATGFAQGPGLVALRPDEVLTALVLPPRPRWDAVAFEKFRHRVFDAAIVSVTCALRAGADGVAEARLTVGGATPAPTPVPGAAARLVGPLPDPDAVAAAADAAAEEVLPGGATAGEAVRYRHELVRTLVRRAVTRAAADLRRS
ncbi:xanthine dehydrogenase family protein subunit M [Actinomycetospora sp. TBRC 11914]|uniref:FAD binding domain-containing protein n=1 Tax=Actinomycetospora sp. TBRC 11914 TaxID=2729387 RepID=UPI00145F56D8|nr:FAD binding domain-containing protein [Actinomycetospora sp. TBRC 11914]NMO89402.1 hypothetical protein [Actinomycetospora sp. TBRC 11914]